MNALNVVTFGDESFDVLSDQDTVRESSGKLTDVLHALDALAVLTEDLEESLVALGDGELGPHWDGLLAILELDALGDDSDSPASGGEYEVGGGGGGGEGGHAQALVLALHHLQQSALSGRYIVECGGNLAKFLHDWQKLGVEIIIKLCTQLLRTLTYLSYLGKFVFVDKFLEVEGIVGPSGGGQKSLYF